MLAIVNCSVDLYRSDKNVLGRDPVIGNRRKYATATRCSIQPTSTQGLAAREAGMVYQSNYTMYIDYHLALPEASDRVYVDLVYFPGWAQSLNGKWFAVTDAAPSARGLVRCGLAKVDE